MATWLWCSFCSWAQPGAVLTLQGQRLEGVLSLDRGDQVNLVATDGKRRSFGWPDLAEMIFEANPPAPSAPLPEPEPAPPGGGLPAGWTSEDLGRVKETGSVAYAVQQPRPNEVRGVYTIDSAGSDLDGPNDSCHFLHRPLDGNGDAIACIGEVQNTSTRAMAGVMIRASLDPSAVTVALTANPAGELLFIWREQEQTEARLKNVPNPGQARWLKLARRGGQFTACLSKDGTNWVTVASVALDMPAQAQAGALVASGRQKVVNRTKLMGVFLLPAPPEEYLPRLILADRTTLVGRLLPAEAPHLQFSWRGKTRPVPTSEIARLVFSPLSGKMESQLAHRKPGYLTRKGDFVEGAIVAVEKDRLEFKTRSGAKTTRIGDEAVAVLLGDASLHPARFEVVAKGGDRLYADKMSLAKEAIAVEVAGIGSLSVPVTAVSRIRRIGDLDGEPAEPPPPVNMARLKTLEGGTLVGSLRLEQDRIVLEQAGKLIARVELKNVKELVLSGAEAETSPCRGDWTGTDLGQAPLRGSHRFESERLRISGSGTEAWRHEDSGYFVHRVLERSGELMARLADLPDAAATRLAGLMIRESLDDGSRHFLLGQTADGLCWQRRSSGGSSSSRSTRNALKGPTWLKLARVGGRFEASVSTDGKSWIAVAGDSASMPDETHIGFVVAGSGAASPISAVFDRISFRRLSQVDFKPLLVLRSGTEIPSAVNAADEFMLKFVRAQGEERTVATHNVARIVFQPLTPQIQRSLKPGRRGLVLRNGDFIDGELKSMDRNSVTIGSVVFGLRTYRLGSEVIAICLADPDPASEGMELRLRDGSRIVARDARLRQDRLEIDDPRLGDFAVPTGELAGLKRLSP